MTQPIEQPQAPFSAFKGFTVNLPGCVRWQLTTLAEDSRLTHKVLFDRETDPNTITVILEPGYDNGDTDVARLVRQLMVAYKNLPAED